MKSIIFATSTVALALACNVANAEVRIDATWSADVYSFADPSAPPTSLSGALSFYEPYVPFRDLYTFSDGDYEVTLTADNAHGAGVWGSLSVEGPDGSGPGSWGGSVTLVDAVPEPMNATLLLAGLGLVAGVTRRRKR